MKAGIADPEEIFISRQRQESSGKKYALGPPSNPRRVSAA
jgi:hypothetical protein